MMWGLKDAYNNEGNLSDGLIRASLSASLSNTQAECILL